MGSVATNCESNFVKMNRYTTNSKCGKVKSDGGLKTLLLSAESTQSEAFAAGTNKGALTPQACSSYIYMNTIKLTGTLMEYEGTEDFQNKAPLGEVISKLWSFVITSRRTSSINLLWVPQTLQSVCWCPCTLKVKLSSCARVPAGPPCR